MGSRSVKQGESPNLLREKENEISMKIDEAGKGASFHQQVRARRSWEINHAAEGASVRERGSPPSPLSAAWGGLRDKWLRLRPRRWVTMACRPQHLLRVPPQCPRPLPPQPRSGPGGALLRSSTQPSPPLAHVLRGPEQGAEVRAREPVVEDTGQERAGF